MPAFEIPLSPEAQTFSIDLAGATYNMTLSWNLSVSAWVLDIADVNENPILRGIPLVANVDLLAQYPYLNFGGSLIAQTDNDIETPPTFENLGTVGHLYFVTTP